MFCCSTLAGIAIAQTGTSAVHALGYPLTYYKDLPHGLANGVTTKAALEFMAQDAPDRVKQVIKAMGCHDLAEVGNLFNKVLPAVDIKLTAEEQARFVEKTLQAKNLTNCPRRPEEKDIYEMLRRSKRRYPLYTQ